MKQVVFIAIIGILISACNRDETNIPYYPVNITIYLDDPQWINLSATGGYEYITGGSKGIILFRTSPSQIVAYERHCTYNPNEGCKISMDSSFVSATDDACCGSSFSMFDGSIISGPAVLPLRIYHTEIIDNVLYIRN